MIRDQLLNILLAARDTVRIHQVERCRVLTSDDLFAFYNPDGLFVDICHLLPRASSERRAKA